jgi:hypothetical protein
MTFLVRVFNGMERGAAFGAAAGLIASALYTVPLIAGFIISPFIMPLVLLVVAVVGLIPSLVIGFICGAALGGVIASLAPVLTERRAAALSACLALLLAVPVDVAYLSRAGLDRFLKPWSGWIFLVFPSLIFVLVAGLCGGQLWRHMARDTSTSHENRPSLRADQMLLRLGLIAVALGCITSVNGFANYINLEQLLCPSTLIVMGVGWAALALYHRWLIASKGGVLPFE